jgi:hypothetical protein
MTEVRTINEVEMLLEDTGHFVKKACKQFGKRNVLSFSLV